MWRWKSMMAATLIICSDMLAQEYDTFAIIAEFLGNASAEEIDPEEVERLERYIEHPLKINIAGQSRLEECGLLTQYQTASLMDYLTRHGDILSLTELAAVDGFGTDFVRRLSFFISLESGRLPGNGGMSSKRFHQELEVKATGRCNDELIGQYALKYRIGIGDSLQASFSLSKSSAAGRPDAFPGNVFWYFRRYGAKVAVGNFNARFGQGLALWSGMSISGLSKPSSYLKRSSNLSPSYSYTGNYSFKGLAAEAIFGNFKMTYITTLSGSEGERGLLPAVNLTLLCTHGQVGLTHYADFRLPDGVFYIPDMKTSFDLAMTLRGVDLFAETAYDWNSDSVASLAGVVFPAGENLRVASALRYYPSAFQPTYSAAIRALTKCTNEYGCSTSAEFSSGQWIDINGSEGFGSNSRRLQGGFCADGAYFPVSKSDDGRKSVQLKSLAEIKVMITGALALKFRLAERFRTWDLPFRTDARMDLFYYSSVLDMNFRANLVKCNKTSFLTYAEGTVKSKSLKLSLRSGLFFADNWDDRIYAYERDLPGSFNVPAFYGRGYWISLNGNWRFAKWGRAYINASLTEYPFMEKKKLGKAELKLMLRFQI